MKRIIIWSVFGILFFANGAISATLTDIGIHTNNRNGIWTIDTFLEIDDGSPAYNVSYSIDGGVTKNPMAHSSWGMYGVYNVNLPENPSYYKDKTINWYVEDLAGNALMDISADVGSDIMSQMPESTKLQIVNGGMNPTIKWNNLFDFSADGLSNNDEFRIRVGLVGEGAIFDDKILNFYHNGINDYSYTFNSFDFESGLDYWIRIEAREYKDLSNVVLNNVGGYDSVAFSNRSINYISYTNPVPEPTTIILFGVALLGLAGVSRKETG